MHPPAHICKALANLHPQLRLGWMGGERVKVDEQNVGHFAVVQLYNVRDVGTYEDPRTIKQFWDVEDYVDWDDGELKFRRAYRGPLFNKTGGVTPDWDPLFRIPVIVCAVAPTFGFTTQDIYDGKFITKLKQWLRPAQERRRASKVAQETEAKAHKERVDNMAGSMLDYLAHLNRKQSNYHRSAVMARKHYKQDWQYKEIMEGKNRPMLGFGS